MTNDEIERVMNFIIKQQESFADNWLKSDDRMTRLESAFVGVFNMVTETAKAQRKLTEAHLQLSEAEKRTDERLRALMKTVDRYIHRHNGN